jgi:hypothetical protein
MEFSRDEIFSRSPIEHVQLMHTPLLLLHRKHHPQVTENEVLGFAEKMNLLRVECKTIFRQGGDVDQKFYYDEVMQICSGWVKEHLLR